MKPSRQQPTARAHKYDRRQKPPRPTAESLHVHVAGVRDTNGSQPHEPGCNSPHSPSHTHYTHPILSSLNGRGPDARIAAALIIAHRASAHAKGLGSNPELSHAQNVSVRDRSYTHKCDAMRKLVSLLDGSRTAIQWGWGIDRKYPDCPHVLFVDLPTGQVSFHSPERMLGPDYKGRWDKRCMNRQRIFAFCETLRSAS